MAQGAENIRARILELHDCDVPEEPLEADLEYSVKNGDNRATTALEFLCETIWNHIPTRCERCNDEIECKARKDGFKQIYLFSLLCLFLQL